MCGVVSDGWRWCVVETNNTRIFIACHNSLIHRSTTIAMVIRPFSLLPLFCFSFAVAFVPNNVGLSPTKSSRVSTPLFSTVSENTSMSSEVKVGDKIPQVTLMEGLGDFEKEEVDLVNLIANKKVAIFGVPGAFTPGCSRSHLPSFISAQDELKGKGVEMTICVATNDVYVMEAWGRESGGTAAGIRFLSDHQAELTKALGLLIESPVMLRSKRFSLIADNGVVTHYFSSAEQSSDTWAPAVLSKL